jgi:hypothetical protein
MIPDVLCHICCFLISCAHYLSFIQLFDPDAGASAKGHSDREAHQPRSKPRTFAQPQRVSVRPSGATDVDPSKVKIARNPNLQEDEHMNPDSNRSSRAPVALPSQSVSAPVPAPIKLARNPAHTSAGTAITSSHSPSTAVPQAHAAAPQSLTANTHAIQLSTNTHAQATIEIPRCAKLVDPRFHFSERSKLLLGDSPTPYLVVGVVGLMGTGKSTVLSALLEGEHTLSKPTFNTTLS